MKNDKDIPISRAVGRFFGHLWHSTTKPVDTKKETTTVSKSTQESQGEINGQKVTLRKTTIEEVEFRNDQ
ncbi:MAG: hypothetical protein P1U30_05480 [Phycisphaerales bacterium]|nr:hypothetical protein [Phycisphaerales bacterium]